MKIEALFISDVHIGSKGCNAKQVLETLKQFEPEYLFIVGDFIDGWLLKKKFRWPQSHTNVIRKILSYSKNNTKVIYIPGNHDEFLRDYSGTEMGNISLVNEAIHHGENGKRYLVIHGDQFDLVTMNAKWLAMIGGWVYDRMIDLNRYIHMVYNIFDIHEQPFIYKHLYYNLYINYEEPYGFAK